jgi:predicted neuraminidase
MRGPGVRWFLIFLAVVLNGLTFVHPGARLSSSAGFVLPDRIQTASTEPLFEEELVNPHSPQPVVHVASICELPDGQLAATWYGGSREGATDVAIYFATRPRGEQKWSPSRAIVTPDLATRELGRAVRKVGNSLIFCDETGKLWLLYVTITAGGWSSSSLNLTTSTDQGRSWAPSRRLTLSPFFNLSELVKNGPIALANGGWAVPMYHELVGQFPELLWLSATADGFADTKSRIVGGRAGFQPAVTPLSKNRAVTFLRDTTPRKRITVSRTADYGRTWSSPEALDLPNPDSGLDALRLADGRLLLAFNDSRTGRENLRLAASTDDGCSWKRVATLAEESKTDFSYPFLIQTRDGNIHVVFTWKGKAIKHVVFNAAWLNTKVEPSPGSAAQ